MQTLKARATPYWFPLHQPKTHVARLKACGSRSSSEREWSRPASGTAGVRWPRRPHPLPSTVLNSHRSTSGRASDL